MWWSDIAGPPQSGPEAEVLDKAVVWAARVQGWPSSKVQCSWFTSPQPCFCSWLFFLQLVQGRVRSVSFKIWKFVGNWDALFPDLESLGNTWGAFPRAGKFGEIIYISFLRPGKFGKIRFFFFFKDWKVWGNYVSHFQDVESLGNCISLFQDLEGCKENSDVDSEMYSLFEMRSEMVFKLIG